MSAPARIWIDSEQPEWSDRPNRAQGEVGYVRADIADELLAGAKAAMAAARAHLHDADRDSIPIKEAGLIYDIGVALREAIDKAEGETE